MGDIFWAILSNSTSHNYNLCQNAKKYVILCRVSICAKMQKIIDSLIKENESMSLHTPMNTPLSTQIRQGQFSWHLQSERTTCVSKERCLAVGRLILMVSLAFLLKLMQIIKKNSSNCVSSRLGFMQCLRGICMKILAYFRHSSRAHFKGDIPKLVEWVSFRNFGFKVNLAKITLSE